MATQILAPGTTVSSSSPVTVAAGSTVTFGIFVASGDLPNDALASLDITTPGASIKLGTLNRDNPVRQVAGPAIITLTRHSGGRGGVAVGGFTES